MSDLILYTSEDGKTRLDLRVDGGSVWLSQLELAELFQTTKQNVSLHAKNILEDGELQADSVVKESLTTATDGKKYRRPQMAVTSRLRFDRRLLRKLLQALPRSPKRLSTHSV